MTLMPVISTSASVDCSEKSGAARWIAAPLAVAAAAVICCRRAGAVCALAAAVALRHLQLIQEWDVVANVRARSTQLRDALVARVECRAAVRDVRICGLLAGVELDDGAGGAVLARRVCAQMVRLGVLSRSLGAIITLVPPLTTTSSEIERIVDVLVRALDDVGAV